MKIHSLKLLIPFGTSRRWAAGDQWMLLFLLVAVVASIYFYAFYDILLLLVFCTTSYAAGSFVSFQDDTRIGYQMLLRFIVGSLFLSFGVWLSTLHNLHYRELYWAVSVILIAVRWRYIRRLGRNIHRYYRLYTLANPWLLVLFCSVCALFFLYASYPIHNYDALTKHINIPVKILSSTHYDYDVIESLVFGESSLFMHMTGLYLLALGGKKALMYVVAFMSLVMVSILLRFLRSKEGSSPWGAALFLLLYAVTPLTLDLSAYSYGSDTFMLPFLFMVAAYVLDSPARAVVRNFPLLFLLIGAAQYAKPNASNFIFCLVALMLLRAGMAVQQGEISLLKTFKNLVLGLPMMFAPWLPAMLIIWYKTGNPMFPFANDFFKSIYFIVDKFNPDAYTNKLGLDFSSLWSMVFHTDRNMGMPPYGLGVHLLLLPVALIVPLFRRNWKIIGFAVLCIANYLVSIRITYNIRYFLPAFVLSIFLVAYAIGWILQRIPNITWRSLLGVSVHVGLAGPCIALIFFLPAWSSVKYVPDMLKPHAELTLAPIDSVYAHIQDKSSRVLLNAYDPYRSTYPGFLCSLSWHNTFLLELLRNEELSEHDLLASFDYVITTKGRDNPYRPGVVDRNKEMLETVFESDGYILFKVKHVLKWQEVFSESYPDGVDVTVAKPKTYPIQGLGARVKLVLEFSPTQDGGKPEQGRFQINWLHSVTGKFTGTSLIPFDLQPGRNTYEHVFDTESFLGMLGVVYLASHDERPVRAFGLKVWSTKTQQNVLKKYLDEYGAKWPPLASVLKEAR
nr:hypothetical protein [Desulfobacula sp.]